MSKDGTPEGYKLQVTTHADGSQLATFVPKDGKETKEPKEKPNEEAAVEEPSKE